MVNMIIDGKHVSAEENITIMEAAERNGIPIPKLCYLKGINEIAACRVCVVELEGKEKLITSCNNLVKEGMVIHTNSPKVRNHRRNTVQLLLSQHDNRCVVCPRNGNCGLQQVAYDLNILKGLSSYKEWTRRSEEIGRMIGGFINTVNGANSDADNTATQQQKSSRYGNSRYKRH